jgi:hypothetical protein
MGFDPDQIWVDNNRVSQQRGLQLIPKGQHMPDLDAEHIVLHHIQTLKPVPSVVVKPTTPSLTVGKDVFELKIRKLSAKDIAPNSRLIIVGQTGGCCSGIKRELLRGIDSNSKGLIMTYEERLLADLTPNSVTRRGYHSKQLADFLTRRRQYIRTSPTTNNRTAPVVIDYCDNDLDAYTDTVLKDLFMNGRCLDLMVIVATEAEAKAELPPTIRYSADYTFILKRQLLKRKDIWERYACIFPKLQMFNDAFDAITSGDTCLVIKNGALKLEDALFWFKSP